MGFRAPKKEVLGMKKRKSRIIKVVFFVALGIFALCITGCDDTVVIHYRQLGNFGMFDTNPGGSPHSTTQTRQGCFVVYCITAIENTGDDAKDFNFVLSKIHAGSSVGPGVAIADPYLKTAPNTKLVKANKTEFIGRFVIDAGEGGPDIPPGGNKYCYTLTYDNSVSGESILMVHDNTSDTQNWLNNGVMDPAHCNMAILNCSPK